MITHKEFKKIMRAVNEALVEEYGPKCAGILIEDNQNNPVFGYLNICSIDAKNKKIQTNCELLNYKYPYMDAETVKKRLLEEIKDTLALGDLFSPERT